MYKKILLSVSLALLIALLGSSLALAADTAWPAIYFGQITAISDESFTLQNKGTGGAKTVLVTSSTRYARANGDTRAFSNLGELQWVVAIGSRTGRNELTAHTVVQLPRNANRAVWTGKREYGQVKAVDRAAGTFTLDTAGGARTFTVTDKTQWVGAAKTLKTLKVGSSAVVGYQRAGSELRVKAIIDLP